MPSVDDVYNQVRKDGKRSQKMSLPIFLATIFVIIPLWLSVLLPLSFFFQIYKAILGGSKDDPSEFHDHEGKEEKFPSSSQLKSMEKRKYDVVLLGATGFAGNFAARHLAKTYGVGGNVKWALAGRLQAKLDKIKSDMAKELGKNEIMNVDVIIVDTSDRSTLHKLVDNTRVVVTTVGPYAKYGSSVVEFCAKYGTHYVDITGEVFWWEKMIMKWDDTAQRTGAKIVSLCGNDSIPWDLTVHKLSQLLKEKCNDDLVTAECLYNIQAAPSGGTIASLLPMLDLWKKQEKFAFNPVLRKPDGSKSTFETKLQNLIFISRCRQDRFSSTWLCPSVMAPINGQVIARTHALKGGGNQVITYKEAKLSGDFKTAFVELFSLTLLGTALLNPITGEFLKKFVFPKPGEGPSKEELDKGFLCVPGFGYGTKGGKVESVMYFPDDPGYRETGRMIAESGLCLALDASKLPTKGGGVLTPASAMGDVLLDRLCKTGTMFASRVVPT